jgi:hypothetical protein
VSKNLVDGVLLGDKRKKGGLLNSLLISASFSCLFLSYNFLYFLLILSALNFLKKNLI